MLEICVDSILSARIASENGAHRIELCSALSEGGLTPSMGLFLGVKRALQNTKTKIFCMIRIRRGNFEYSEEEIESMIEDVKYFKENNADGIVFGSLDSKNEINIDHCQKIIHAWKKQSLTFHRAFDETEKENFKRNIDILVSLGFERILSSGFEANAEMGIKNLKQMVNYCRDVGIIVMCGAGINEINVEKVMSETGATEIHASARSESKMSARLSMGGTNDSQPLMICDPLKVKEIIKIIQTF